MLTGQFRFNGYQAMPSQPSQPPMASRRLPSHCTMVEAAYGLSITMTALQHPDAIRHFQSLCDACQELSQRYHGPSELRLYADGYLHALRRTGVLDHHSQRRLEELIERWILDPSSFVGPDGDPRTLYESSRI